MAYDILIKGGTVVDGTGAPGFRADVALQDGRIAEIGTISAAARRTIDATGLVVAPGAIDVHTHYDAEVVWNGLLGASAEHGVTTVVQGNCGIGIAPCKPQDREAVVQDLVILEGVSYESLNAGIDWKFETFPEYLDCIRKRGLGINVAAFVPLSPMRRYVIGEPSVERGATPEERTKIAQAIREAVEAGALGFSATTVRRQVGYKGNPMPGQLTDADEMREYARVLRDLGKGAMQFNVIDAIAKPTKDELSIIGLLVEESGGRPVTFSGALHRTDDPSAVERMLQMVEPLRRRGARPQTTTIPFTMEINFRSPMMFADVGAFKMALSKPREEQIAMYSDPAWRAQAKANLAEGGKIVGDWKSSTVHHVKSAQLQPLLDRTIDDIARERGQDPLDVMMDLAIADNLEFVIRAYIYNSDPKYLRQMISDSRILLGQHDAGAHVDMMFMGNFPTHMLGHWVREEQAISLEHAIQRMTSDPADFFGFADRGRIAPGKAGDIMVFDPATVQSSTLAEKVLYDLPAGGKRLYSPPTGMEYVLVNGEVLFDQGKHTGALPGKIVNG
ncbi:N-acyl-D-amino-acid deacylase family protein [Ramlibacter sp.]|uniref:N-acyl-D-amino-acid deacylase family protein n=1 Tax=Ramlibacter sp. TaxID=1917967 RepID=UPI003D0D1E0E